MLDVLGVNSQLHENRKIHFVTLPIHSLSLRSSFSSVLKCATCLTAKFASTLYIDRTLYTCPKSFGILIFIFIGK